MQNVSLQPFDFLFIFITRLNIASHVTNPSLPLLALPRMRWNAVECVTPCPRSVCINKQTLEVYQTSMKIYRMYILHSRFMQLREIYRDKKSYDRCFSKIARILFLVPHLKGFHRVKRSYIHVSQSLCDKCFYFYLTTSGWYMPHTALLYFSANFYFSSLH